MEKALLKKLMSYSYLVAAFFKDQFKKSDGQYVIPFSFILNFKRRVFPLIRDSCNYVCPFAYECDGHQFLNFIETLYQFQQHAIFEKKCFYKDFCFYNFRLNDKEEIADWDFYFYTVKDLSQYTFSQRAQYLN